MRTWILIAILATGCTSYLSNYTRVRLRDPDRVEALVHPLDRSSCSATPVVTGRIERSADGIDAVCDECEHVPNRRVLVRGPILEVLGAPTELVHVVDDTLDVHYVFVDLHRNHAHRRYDEVSAFEIELTTPVSNVESIDFVRKVKDAEYEGWSDVALGLAFAIGGLVMIGAGYETHHDGTAFLGLYPLTFGTAFTVLTISDITTRGSTVAFAIPTR